MYDGFVFRGLPVAIVLILVQRTFGGEPVDELMHFVRPNGNLAAQDLAGADLGHIVISGADFSHANLAGAELNYSVADGAKFQDADCRGADLTYSVLANADFSGADLREANFSHSVLTDANFNGADLRGSTFSYSVLFGQFNDKTIYDERTRFPREFDAKAHGLTLVSRGSEADAKKGTDVFVGQDNVIYGNRLAARLVVRARQFDPLFVPPDRSDRDTAIRFYEMAIESQPGANSNSPLANRIAQMYAFYSDREMKYRTDPNEARKWWERCLTITASDQLLWLQTQMGIASTCVRIGDHVSAIAAYDEILNADASQFTLENWKDWSRENEEEVRFQRERLCESLERIKAKAAETKEYAKGLLKRRQEIKSRLNSATPPE